MGASVSLVSRASIAIAVAALTTCTLAGCGPADGHGGPGPRTNVPPPSPTGPGPDASATPSPSASPSASGTGTDTATRPPVTPGEPMRPIAPSAMEAELREIGLDPADLPPLNKMDPAMLRKVMKPFAKSLGVACTHCHDAKSFKAPTPNKAIATHMWNAFARDLAMKDGSPLFCDSCHGGKATFLDRSNTAALSEWMKDNYTDKLVRLDKKDHGCATCHGEPFEAKFLAKRAK